MVREGDGEGLPQNGIGGGVESEGERGESRWVDDGGNGEGAGIEGDFAGVRGGEGEERGGVDGGGREIEVEGEGDVGGERVGRVCVGVRVNGRHFLDLQRLVRWLDGGGRRRTVVGCLTFKSRKENGRENQISLTPLTEIRH